MSKYNPANDQHRTWLAQNVLSLLRKWGFQIKVPAQGDVQSWEFICERTDKFNPNKSIIIYTGIDKTSGAMREYATDRIRCVVRRDWGEGNVTHERVGRINRVGEFKEINSRICQTILSAQKKLKTL